MIHIPIQDLLDNIELAISAIDNHLFSHHVRIYQSRSLLPLSIRVLLLDFKILRIVQTRNVRPLFEVPWPRGRSSSWMPLFSSMYKGCQAHCCP